MSAPSTAVRLPAGWILGRTWEIGAYQLVAVREADIDAIRTWRNDQIDVLRQPSPLSADEQLRWFRDTVTPVHNSDQPVFLLWSMLENDRALAYGGLTHISWRDRRAEISFLAATAIARSPNYRAVFSSFLEWISTLAFDALGLHRLYTETYAFRSEQIAILEDCSFQLEGRLRDHVVVGDQFVDALLHARLAALRQ